MENSVLVRYFQVNRLACNDLFVRRQERKSQYIARAPILTYNCIHKLLHSIIPEVLGPK